MRPAVGRIIDLSGPTLTIERSVATMGRGNLVVADQDTRRPSARPRRVRRDRSTATPVRRRGRAGISGLSWRLPTPCSVTTSNRPIAPDTISHFVRRIAGTVGVDMHLHSLRHFAATQRIGAGVDVRTVAGRLGHRDASVTLRVYASALPERDRGRCSVPRTDADCRHDVGRTVWA